MLVAEDDSRLAQLLVQAIEENGWVATHRSDGGTALAEARTGVHDVLLLDWGLPVLDGAAVLQALRHEGYLIPVLLLTARGGARDKVAGLDHGADDYLTKPFDVDELLARLRALHRRASSAAADVLRADDLAIDLAARTVARAGVPIDLSAREFDLLVLLVRRRGQVVTRSVIIEHLLDGDAEPRSNIVDVYVAALRAKIDKPFERSDLRTVRGVGYRFGAGPDHR